MFEELNRLEIRESVTTHFTLSMVVMLMYRTCGRDAAAAECAAWAEQCRQMRRSVPGVENEGPALLAAWDEMVDAIALGVLQSIDAMEAAENARKLEGVQSADTGVDTGRTGAVQEGTAEGGAAGSAEIRDH